MSAAVEQSRCKANMVAWGDWKLGPWSWTHHPSQQKKSHAYCIQVLNGILYAKINLQIQRIINCQNPALFNENNY